MHTVELAASKAQHIIVTGCASGIGRRLAGELARRGHRLMATDVDLTALEQAAERDGWPRETVRLAALDVRNGDAWEQVLDSALAPWPRIDVLYNVAGVVQPGYVHEIARPAIDFHLDINAKGVILGTQAASRRMVAQGAGQIVNIASLAGIAAVPGLALYSASKFAVRGFSLAVAQELRPHGVYVTVVCPDAVQTAMVDLQIDYPEAALTFSGKRILSVDQVVEILVGQVLEKRPLEVMIPRSRGWMAKLTSLWPGLAGALLPRLTQQGLSRQRRMQASRGAQSTEAPPAPGEADGHVAERAAGPVGHDRQGALPP